jgi:hypothetical protein
VIGGGHVPLPAEGSLAPPGMRFRDAQPECRRHRLEVLASRSRMVSCEGPPGLHGDMGLANSIRPFLRPSSIELMACSLDLILPLSEGLGKLNSLNVVN